MITAFKNKLNREIEKTTIDTLQVNLGYMCNLACKHCHVEASPKRTEEISHQVKDKLLQIIGDYEQIKTVDLTGGAPEMHNGFREIVKKSRELGKEVIVRSNLTIFFEEGYQDLPEFFAEQKVQVVASLPCYLEENVDKMRGKNVFKNSIEALQLLNNLGYGRKDDFRLDLVYNPMMPETGDFVLAPEQTSLEKAYKKFLQDNFGVQFHSLITINNIPVGRFKLHLQRKGVYDKYLKFLEENYNDETVDRLMCRNQLSIDYQGNIYDCDFNQMEKVSAINGTSKPLTIDDILEASSLDVIKTVQVGDYCYGCTAGCGSSCGGSLL